MLFEDDHFIYLNDKNKNESFEFYYAKSLFISKCSPNNLKEYNYYLKFANIYCNINLYNCKYPQSIHTILDNIIKTKNIGVK